MKKIFNRSLIMALVCTLCLFLNSFAQISFTADTTLGCDSLTVTFTNTSSIGVYYYWQFDDGDNYIGFDTSHTFYPGNYNVNLFALDSAYSPIGFITMQITVFGLTWAGSGLNPACPGEEVSFYFDGAGNGYFWDFGDGYTSISEQPTHTYNSAGTYTVMFVLNFNCGAGADTSTFPIIIDTNTVPNAQFGFNPPTACPDDYFQFYHYYYSGSSEYYWNFGDGKSDSIGYPIHKYDTSGIYLVSLSVTNACGNMATYVDTVVVSNSAPFGFAGLNTTSACPGDVVQYQIYGDQTAFSAYVWNFGDGSPLDSSSTPLHTYTDTGTYNVNVTVTNGCGFDTTLTATAYINTTSVPVLGQYMFGTPDQTAYCPGDSVLFFFFGISNNLWSFGDGNTAVANDTFLVQDQGNEFYVTIIQHAFSDTGYYWVSLTLTNNCGNSATDSLQVYIGNSLPATADFVWTAPQGGGNYSACEEVNFLSFGGVLYTWNFGDGDTLVTSNSTAVHTYTAAGNYLITLAVTNGCGNSDVASNVITIDGMGATVSAVNVTTNGGNNGSATVSAFGGNEPYTFSWSTIPSQTDSVATGLAAGTYMVTVTDSAGCAASFSVLISEPPVGIAGAGESDESIKIYPNPNTGKFIVELYAGDESNTILEITNVLGQKVYSDRITHQGINIKEIDLAGIQKGIYFLNTGNSLNRKTIKVMVY